MVAPEFMQIVGRNVTYWRDQVTLCEDPALRELAADTQNIYRAIDFALSLAETCREASELLLELNYFIEHSGAWRPWSQLYQRAVAHCEVEDTRLRLRLLDHAGQNYRHERQWELALAAHQEEEQLATAIGDGHALAGARFNLATIYWRLREYDRAETYARQALTGFLENGASDRELGGVHVSLGLIAYGRGAFDQAVRYLTQGVEHFRCTQLTVLQARALVNLALAQEGADSFDEALDSYEEARELLVNTDYEMEKTRIELSLGSLFFNAGQLELAEEAYLRAYSPFLKDSGLLYFQGLTTNNLGNVYLEQGRLGEAELILRESLQIWDKARGRLQRANTLGALAKTLAAQDRLPEALDAYDEAIRGTKAYPEDDWAAQLLIEFREERDQLLHGLQNKKPAAR